jgi:hypothetical protein
VTTGDNDQGRNLAQWLSLAGLFVAPTTLLTGLCYYLGFVSTRHHLLYFGVDPAAVGFTSTDYILKAVVVNIIPVIAALLLALSVLGIALVVQRIAATGRGASAIRAGAWALVVTAVASIGIATASLRWDIVWLASRPWPSTLGSLLLGILLVAVGHLLCRRPREATARRARVESITGRICTAIGVVGVLNALVWPLLRWLWSPHGSVFMTWTLFAIGGTTTIAAYWTLLITRARQGTPRPLASVEPIGLALTVALIVVSLFSLTGQYAIRKGDQEGVSTQAELWGRDIGVSLETSNPLLIPPNLVNTTPLTPADAAGPTRFRYECLRALEIRSGHWVLVPAKWNRERGYAVIVTPDNATRLTTTVHAGRAAQIGGGDNVTRFWQCPEAVPTYTEVDAKQSLLTTPAVRTVFPTAEVAVEPSRNPPNIVGSSASGPAPRCAQSVNKSQTSTLVPDYRDVVGIKIATRTLGGDGIWVDQGSAVFPTATEAYTFFVTVKDIWRQCHGDVVGVARHHTVEPRRLVVPAPNEADGIFWVHDAPATGAGVPDCSQAVAAKANIVIDVDVCGGPDRSAAAQLVKAIRDRIPNSVGE